MKLKLDQSHKPFRPGETIVGQVELGADEGSTDQLHLILEGRAKTKTREKSGDSQNIYRARAPLLYQLETLHVESLVSAGDDALRVVPFSLAIPVRVPELTNVPTTKDGFMKSYWNYSWTSKPDFQHEAGHALPPTFSAEPRRGVTKSECYVEYSVTAIGSQIKSVDDAGKPAHVEICGVDTQPFWMQTICPLAESMFRRPERELAQTAHLLSVQAARLLANDAPDETSKLTLKQRLKKVVRPAKQPEINFKAMLEVPKYLRVGEKVLISLQLERNRRRNSVADTSIDDHQISFPDVQIDMVEMNIKHTTHIRTCGSVKNHFDSWSETAWTEKQIHGLVGTTLPVWSGDPSTFELPSTTSIPSRLTPTFATYNISRSYFIRVTVSMTVAGEQKFVNYSSPIDIHSKPVVVNTPHITISDTTAGADQHALVIPADGKAAQLAERTYSGLSSEDQSLEDWGEQQLTVEDKHASREMASFAVEALGSAPSHFG